MEIEDALQTIKRELGGEIAAGNSEAVEKLQEARPHLIDVLPAIDVVPGMEKDMVLHAGLEIDFKETDFRQAYAFREAIIGCVLHEGLADSREEAIRLLETGDVKLSPCYQHGCIGSVAGVVSAKTPMLVVENKIHGNTSFCTVYEGPQMKRLNFGVYDEEVAENLKWIEKTLAPFLSSVIRAAGGVDLKSLISRALHMGDECHSRNTGATSLFVRKIMPYSGGLGFSAAEIREVGEFIDRSDQFFAHCAAAAAKNMLDVADGVGISSVITGMVENCREFAIRVGGLGWFTAPVEEKYKTFEGRGFGGREYDLSEVSYAGGESVYKECIGIGACAMAAAPALCGYQGGTPQEMIIRNKEMYKITVAENKEFKIPFWEYRGTPTGFDIIKIAETGILPYMDEGVAGVEGGMIAAGNSRVPWTAIEKGIKNLYEKAGGKNE